VYCAFATIARIAASLNRDTIRAAAIDEQSPADVLHRLNAVLVGHGSPAFAGVACARLDLRRGSVAATVACGGHPAPRVLRANGVVAALGEHGSPLGVLGAVALTDRRTRLGSGDALVLYTDRLTEAAAPTVWTPEDLHMVIARAIGRTAQGIVDHLAATIEGPLREDLVLFALRVKPEPSDR